MTRCFAFLLIPTLGKWMNFIFNEDPDHVSQNLILCLLHFTVNSFTNKTQFDAGFSERLKLKDDADYIDPTVMSQHTSVNNCFYDMVTIALSVKQIVWYEYLCGFNLNHSSVHLWQSVTTISQSQQWAFTSESTIRHAYSFWWGVKNRTENSLLLLNYVFWCKKYNIIRRPQRTVQRQFITPFS